MSWETIDEPAGIWSAEYRVPMMKARSTAIRLSNGGFLVYSPGAGLEADFASAFGQAEILLAPNNYHHLGLPSWQAQFPDAIAAAADAAHRRLRRQGRTGLVGLDVIGGALPEHVALLEPEGTRIGEVWLRVETGRGVVWVIGDAFFNFPHLARRFRARFVQRLAKSAPGLAMSRLMKWGGLASRRRFKEWVLTQLDMDEPAVLVPVHGDVYDTPELTEALRSVVHARL